MPGIFGNKFVVVGDQSPRVHASKTSLAAGSGEVVLMDNLALGSTDNIKTLLEDSRCTFLRGDVQLVLELSLFRSSKAPAAFSPSRGF